MIKKSIFGLFVLLIGIVNFSFADLSDNREYTLSSIGEYNISPVDGNLSFTVNFNGNFATEKGGISKNVLSFSSKSNGNSQYYIYLFWSSDQKPYYLINYKYWDDYYGGKWYKQGYLKKYFVCDGGYTTGFNINNCVGLDLDNSEYYSNMSSILGSIKSNDYFWYYVGQPTFENNSCLSTIPNFSSTICMGSSQLNKSICFSDTASKIDGRFDSQPVPEDCKPIDWENTTGSLDLLYNIDLLDFPSGYLGSSPGIVGGSDVNLGDGGIGLESNDSALNYYEKRYGWDERICYVGTDSLNYLYGQSGISFNEGTGLSIFDVYSQLYGSGYELVWVGNWLNTWLLNYEQWFNSRGINAEGVGHPSWLSYYNSGTHLGDLQFDDLTFPFVNQPVAFYFMATYIDQNSPYSTMGGPVVSYCNIKINGGSFEDIIDQSDKNNITDFTENQNEKQGLNSDGTERDYGAWLSSGVNVAFSGDVTVKNTLKNFFDQFYNFFNIDIQDTTVRRSSSSPILPGRLASCLLFVVLFKFIRKR